MGELTERDDDKIRVSDLLKFDQKICGNAFMEKIKAYQQCLTAQNVLQEKKRKYKLNTKKRLLRKKEVEMIYSSYLMR